MNDIAPEVLDFLICPSCRSRLAWDYEASELVCSGPTCGLAFPVRSGIPILIESEARRPQTV